MKQTEQEKKYSATFTDVPLQDSVAQQGGCLLQHTKTLGICDIQNDGGRGDVQIHFALIDQQGTETATTLTTELSPLQNQRITHLFAVSNPQKFSCSLVESSSTTIP